MDFSYSEEEEAFRIELRNWLENNIPDGWLEGNRSLPENLEEYSTLLREWQYKLYQGGWATIAWSREFGGGDTKLMERIIHYQEVVRVQPPQLINYIGTNMVSPTLIDSGENVQQKRYLEKILTGEENWCQGYSK